MLGVIGNPVMETKNNNKKRINKYKVYVSCRYVGDMVGAFAGLCPGGNFLIAKRGHSNDQKWE